MVRSSPLKAVMSVSTQGSGHLTFQDVCIFIEEDVWPNTTQSQISLSHHQHSQGWARYVVWRYIEEGHGHPPGPGSASSGESRGRTLNRTSKHAELLQCQALGWGGKSSATCTPHSERHYEVGAFDPTVSRWGKWSPERWRNTPRAPRRLTAEPTLLYCAEAWAKWGPEQREGLKSGDRVLYHQGPATGRRQECQLASSWRVSLDPSSPVEYVPLPSVLFFIVFVSWKCGRAYLACLAEQQEMHSRGQCQLVFFGVLKKT